VPEPERVETTLYTDGACIGNPGPGGWAWAVDEDFYESGADPATTNQRMELTAVIEAVGAFPGRLLVVSDSTYVVNCFRDRWWERWRRRGWLNSNNKPVANRDLWAPLVSAVIDERPGQIRFRWVKGHDKDPLNNFVDGLAQAAARAGRGQASPAAPPGHGRDRLSSDRLGSEGIGGAGSAGPQRLF
jgi:ribonuclease HI